MKYSVYVRNEKEGPSCYYRIIQYLNQMEKNIQENIVIHNTMTLPMFRINMHCKNLYIKKVIQVILYVMMLLRITYFVKKDLKHKVDFVLVSRETLPKHLPHFLKKLLKKLYQNVILIWDFDDDIFYSKEISVEEAKLLKKYSRNILVTSEYLKNLLSKEEQLKVKILPTTDGGFQKDDKRQLIEKRASVLQKEVRLIWVGTSSNLKSLESIIGELDQFAKFMMKRKRYVVLTVVCNQKLEASCSFLVIKNIIWTRKKAERAIRDAHIGIMPLLDNKNSLGKGGFKLIQYMAAALPIVASAVGYNIQIVKNDYGRLVYPEGQDWVKALMELLCSEEEWRQNSYKSYGAWEKKFSYKRNYEIWKRLLIK